MKHLPNMPKDLNSIPGARGREKKGEKNTLNIAKVSLRGKDHLELRTAICLCCSLRKQIVY